MVAGNGAGDAGESPAPHVIVGVEASGPIGNGGAVLRSGMSGPDE
jgi:hypothetical protein